MILKGKKMGTKRKQCNSLHICIYMYVVYRTDILFRINKDEHSGNVFHKYICKFYYEARQNGARSNKYI